MLVSVVAAVVVGFVVVGCSVVSAAVLDPRLLAVDGEGAAKKTTRQTTMRNKPKSIPSGKLIYYIYSL